MKPAAKSLKCVAFGAAAAFSLPNGHKRFVWCCMRVRREVVVETEFYWNYFILFILHIEMGESDTARRMERDALEHINLFLCYFS